MLKVDRNCIKLNIHQTMGTVPNTQMLIRFDFKPKDKLLQFTLVTLVMIDIQKT